jgi:acyl-coenzyme A synthetase/AMP-(fatty) acid ligase
MQPSQDKNLQAGVSLQHLGQLVERVKSGAWAGRLLETSACAVADATRLSAEIDRAARLLQDVQSGDRIIQCLDNSISSISVMLAIWERGAVPIPVKAASDSPTIEKLAADSNARFVLSPGAKTLQATEGYLANDLIVTRVRPARTTGNDLALIIYTSGSTGTPKGIMLSHTNVLSALFAIRSYLKLDTSDVILSVSPLTFDYGLYQVLFSLAFDLTTILYNDYIQPLAVLCAVKRHDVTVLPVVPPLASAIERVLQMYKTDLPTLKKITNTGGHLSETTIKGLRDCLPHTAIYAMYGLTECKRALYLPPEDIDRKIGSVGQPMPGLDAMVVRPGQDHEIGGVTHFFEVKPNEIGELVVRGASVMQGYTRGDAIGAGARLLRGAYRDDVWLATGDLFSYDEDGYYYFRGRIKDLVKQGGYCLYPLEMEQDLMLHPMVESAAVIGATDSDGLEVARAFIKLATPTDAIRKDVLEWISKRFEPEYRPRDIRFVNEMPINAHGKIDRARLAWNASSD